VAALLGPLWLSHPDCREPVILCGDFNATPASATYRQLAGRMRDAQRELLDHRPRHTWFSRLPVRRIDHVFVSRGVTVLGVELLRTELARVASDHLPLLVEVRLD
jgi:endonuclease/exonuclease/phosphatase family metal-dependent hydrolase